MARYDHIAVYLLASQPNGTLYIGVTSDLIQRGLEHREGRFEGFAKKYGCRTLVWWEQFYDINQAIAREKQIKGWKRNWKLALIEKDNPTWRDLYEDFLLLPQHRKPTDDIPQIKSFRAERSGDPEPRANDAPVALGSGSRSARPE